MGDDAPEPLAQHLFMHRIGISVEERDRDALHAGRLQPRHQAFDLGFLERLQHPALMIEALGEPKAAFRRHQRR
ncbi:hypothetical protein ABH992_000571 [Bradyrhizobium yuanmingense]|uniref:Uncharacterized protein n=1 Tax=Bradyrhizobium yuanmingense TaxID=108015 RepID=A0ABV4GAP1_9BRAD